ncbi:helix-turn-helix domain-containing protein [Fulvivirga ligni]|uniref:helix-turn-helix domain-containing protein n=1 Tax=Fulvivirga ligni TaxID=2904246 RepID=UPI001F3E1ABD|nr:helix-turn-helix domain-containing protein [Fulvivirga ligni]UII19752.1 helix-turn-helix domain-containing protein [Fulvivirga ligni]
MADNFLAELRNKIELNLSDEQFGVSELADAMNMSRSNLLRRVKKELELSVSQYIRQIRLEHAMRLLEENQHNVSEVSYQVGFSSTSYFIKCFREHFGYPPGEVGKKTSEPLTENPEKPITTFEKNPKKKTARSVAVATLILCLLAVGYFAFYTKDLPPPEPQQLEKSIAVLPFKNDSNDSTNVYLVNGLMESTLNDLQKIKDLKVISRTSSEKYRNTNKTAPEIAEELQVSYIIEGSGQKIGDNILLNIQLIEGATDRHVWGKQYRRESGDIFKLQQEIAQNIAKEIEAIITPEEQQRIEQIPTDNLEAYDLFLKGKDLFYTYQDADLRKAVELFDQAIKLDPEFSRAYANQAMAYYYLDIYKDNPKYVKELGESADKAFLYDAKSSESLLAKGMFYMQSKQYRQAVTYLEKALEYNPNSVTIINFLSDFYTSHMPNTSKYLEYALRGVQLDIGSKDSITTSFVYLHLSNALLQSGFFDESLEYINKSLAYYPENPYAYIKVYIHFAKDKDAPKAKAALIKELNKDTTRMDITQEIGKLYYYMRDYDSANVYYDRYLQLKESQHLDIYNNQDLNLAVIYEKLGMPDKAKEFSDRFLKYAQNDQTMYKDLYLSVYYAYKNDEQKALDHLENFSNQKDFQFWILLMDVDPVVDDLKKLPRYKKLMKKIESTFWNSHQQIKDALETKGLI